MSDRKLLFRNARHEEFPQLIKMWKTCFKETAEASANIFKKLQKAENIMVLVDDNKVVAMLTIRELTFSAPLCSCKGAYIYGVATLPSEQGKGHSTTLLNDVDKLLIHRKYACSVLVPAEESLFDFYAKRGFEKAININKATVNAADIPNGKKYKLEKIDSQKFMQIRDGRFSDSKFFGCWDEAYLEYIIEDCEAHGGGVFSFELEDKHMLMVCYQDGDTVYVKELGATHKTIDACLCSLKAHFAASKFVLYLREDVNISYTNNLLPFAMIKWYDSNVKSAMRACEGAPPYLAHVLD